MLTNLNNSNHSNSNNHYDVYGLGNALLDIEYEVTPEFLNNNNIQKGLMTLVDEARQLELAKILGESSMRKVACGGSAANTLIALSYFGSKAFYSCKIANDQTGEHYYKDMKQAGLSSNLDFQTHQKGHTGKCMAFVTHDADRTMNTFLGISETLSIQELHEPALKNAKYLYIEGYLMTSPTAFLAVQKAKSIAESAGVKIAMTLSDPFIAGYFKDNFLKILDNKKLDLLFCNQEEAFVFTNTQDLDSAVSILKTKAQSFIITLGSKGSLIVDGSTQEQYLINPTPVTVVDTLGAGDMYAGAFLAGITQGLDFKKSGELASKASAKVITQYGSRLSREEIVKMRAEFF